MLTRRFAVAALAATLGTLTAQEPGPGRGGRGTESWWVNKTAGGIYKPPNRPLRKLSDLKQILVTHSFRRGLERASTSDP